MPNPKPHSHPPGAPAPRAPRHRDPALDALDGVPFNLMQWIGTEMAGDMGSVGNKEVFRHGDHIFMIVKGPNARNDYHVDPYDEIFYQLRGSIEVGLIDPDGAPRTATVGEGEVMLVKAYTPHCPRRPPDTLGLVVERPRVAGEQDGIVWHCPACGHKLHETWLDCGDIEITLKAALDRFNDDEALRTCGACGTVLPDPRAAAAPHDA